jgi:hypothetical protein
MIDDDEVWQSPDKIHDDVAAVLSPAALRAALKAQNPDEDIAAKFGFADVDNNRIDVEGFLHAVNDDPALKSAYITGRGAGRCEFRESQFQLGLANATSNSWWGKQNLGQSEKVETKVTVERIEVTPENASEAYTRLLTGGRPVLPVIDVEALPIVLESEPDV